MGLFKLTFPRFMIAMGTPIFVLGVLMVLEDGVHPGGIGIIILGAMFLGGATGAIIQDRKVMKERQVNHLGRLEHPEGVRNDAVQG